MTTTSLTGVRTPGSLTIRRAIGATVALGLLVPASAAWDNNVTSPTTGVLSIPLTFGLLVLSGLFACAPDEQRVIKLEGVLLVTSLIAMVVVSATLLPGPPRYLDSDAGLLHAGAVSLSAGHDPYTAHLGWSIRAFKFPPAYTTGGGTSTLLTSPSLPLLATYVLVKLRGDLSAATVVQVAALAMTLMILFRALPERTRMLAPLICVAIPLVANQAVGGAGQMLVLPTLVVVAYRWRDTGAGGALDQLDKLRAVALGLALSTNQLAWMIVPFLLVGLFRMRRPELGIRGSMAVLARYGGIALAVFLVANGAFIVWAPGSWAHDLLSWFVGPLAPARAGLPATLTLFRHLGGGNLQAFVWSSALAYAGLLLVYARHFGRLNSLWCVLPCLSLWLGLRADPSDLIVPAVLLLVTALQGGTPPAAADRTRVAGPSRWRRLDSLIALAPAAAAFAVGVAAPAPLLLGPAAPGDGLRTLTLRVTNRSSVPLTPHFQATDGGYTTAFWTIQAGPRTLAAGRTAVYRITDRGGSWSVQSGQPFALEAVTASPETISTAQFTRGSLP